MTKKKEKPIVAIDPVKAEVLNAKKEAESAVKEVKKKSELRLPTNEELMDMDNKMWKHIDDLKAKLYKLSRLTHRVAGRLGIDEEV
tara:strand:+ start:1278 stop:1535 length:258 start_codon:yes stop_codon:yes gene_type:complete